MRIGFFTLSLYMSQVLCIWLAIMRFLLSTERRAILCKHLTVDWIQDLLLFLIYRCRIDLCATRTIKWTHDFPYSATGIIFWADCCPPWKRNWKRLFVCYWFPLENYYCSIQNRDCTFDRVAEHVFCVFWIHDKTCLPLMMICLSVEMRHIFTQPDQIKRMTHRKLLVI